MLSLGEVQLLVCMKSSFDLHHVEMVLKPFVSLPSQAEKYDAASRSLQEAYEDVC